MQASPLLLFPTSRYMPIFQAVGKPFFPSLSSHHLKRSRHLQWLLASFVDIPRLTTKRYARRTTPEAVLKDFALPVRILSLKNDRRSGVIVTTERALEEVLSRERSILVQEIPAGVGLTPPRVSLVFTFYRWIGFSCRFLPDDTSPMLPTDIIETSLRLVQTARLDDIAVEWCWTRDGWRFAGMDFPPLVIHSPQGTIRYRRELLCQQLTEIATGRAALRERGSPVDRPWTPPQ